MDLRKMAEIVAGDRGGIRMRQGVVISAAGSLATVCVAGSTVEIPGVACLAHVSPAPNDVVWLLTDGLDLLVIGKQ